MKPLEDMVNGHAAWQKHQPLQWEENVAKVGGLNIDA